jgi:hypothetical protein
MNAEPTFITNVSSRKISCSLCSARSSSVIFPQVRHFLEHAERKTFAGSPFVQHVFTQKPIQHFWVESIAGQSIGDPRKLQYQIFRPNAGWQNPQPLNQIRSNRQNPWIDWLPVFLMVFRYGGAIFFGGLVASISCKLERKVIHVRLRKRLRQDQR